MAEDIVDGFQLLTPAQAAEMLTISVKTLRQYVLAGEIAFISIGRGKTRTRIAFHREDIIEFIARRKTLRRSTDGPRTRHSNPSIKHELIGFMERREILLAEKRNKKESSRKA